MVKGKIKNILFRNFIIKKCTDKLFKDGGLPGTAAANEHLNLFAVEVERELFT